MKFTCTRNPKLRARNGEQALPLPCVPQQQLELDISENETPWLSLIDWSP